MAPACTHSRLPFGGLFMPVRLLLVAFGLAALAGLVVFASLAGADVTATSAAFGVVAAGAALVGSNRSRSKIKL